MSILVSIMIPAFNHPQYARQAVESALAQDYDNLEVIVSDDSENDETRDALMQFHTNRKFSYYKNAQPSGRVGNYRKLVHELAKGEWVVMLDGDDYYIDNTYISKAVDIIRSHTDLVLVGAGMTVLNELTGQEEFYGLDANDTAFEGKDVFNKYKKVPAHQTSIYPRSLARQLNFYRDSSTASDSESLYRLCLHGKVAYISKPVAVWRIHSTNTTFSRPLRKQIKELVFIDKIYRYAANYLTKQELDQWRRNMYASMCSHLLHLAFAAKKYTGVLMILIRYGKYLGVKLSIVYVLKIAGFYQTPAKTMISPVKT